MGTAQPLSYPDLYHEEGIESEIENDQGVGGKGDIFVDRRFRRERGVRGCLRRPPSAGVAFYPPRRQSAGRFEASRNADPGSTKAIGIRPGHGMLFRARRKPQSDFPTPCTRSPFR